MNDIGLQLFGALRHFARRGDWLLVTGALFFCFVGYWFVKSLFDDSSVNSDGDDGDDDDNANSRDSSFRITNVDLSKASALKLHGPRSEAKAQKKKFECECKMVLVLRRDLKPSDSLAAAWGATVASEVVQVVRAESAADPWAAPALSWLRFWNRHGVAKISTRVDSAEAMNTVVAAAVQKGLPVAGLVENPTRLETGKALAAHCASPKADAVVCIAIGPAPADLYDGVTDFLKLF